MCQVCCAEEWLDKGFLASEDGGSVVLAIFGFEEGIFAPGKVSGRGVRQLRALFDQCTFDMAIL